MAKYTPMMEQYLRIKEENKDCILLFRLGDFYEMFFEDARIASRELEIVLTARDGGNEKIPMCGVPYHAVNNYLSKLINKGFKVAICEQMEDPKQATGIVKREVTRIITPGTILDETMLDAGQNNYLAAVLNVGGIVGFSYIDISTGDFRVTEFNGPDALSKLDNELKRVSPAECLISAEDETNSLWHDTMHYKGTVLTRTESNFTLDESRQILTRHFQVASLHGYGLTEYTAGIKAAALIIKFLYNTHKSRLNHIQQISVYQSNNYMGLDAYTRKNLELNSNLRDGKKEGTLLSVLDHCRTSMGRRMLKKWLDEPLLDIEQINIRLDAVNELVNDIHRRDESRKLLNQVCDLERLAGKIGSGLVNPRDLLALQSSIALLPDIQKLASDTNSILLQRLAALNTLAGVYEIINNAIDENAPLTIKEGGIIKTGFNADIDELKNMSTQGKSWLIDFESREKERTGIKYLKVGYNRIFGYFIEISKSNLNLVPMDYIRKQTLVNTERFITEELKSYEDKILSSRDRLYDLEYQSFMEICHSLEAYIGDIQNNAAMIAAIDVLTTLAHDAYHNDYVRPYISCDGEINIKSGRHPVVEKSLLDSRFVPNDIKMDVNASRFAIITGPNMGGKSTYMRQTAILVIMAQMGSFVPADEARIGIVDRIFTRVGASDDLASGQSTFMVEMLELSHIINNATKDSLIILDEIGRGTSTYDGLSIAQAATEYINDKIAAKTLFATHYHELTELAESNEGIFNLSVSVLDSGETVSFLKKVLAGKADKSYGIHVAKLAGIPKGVINRAYEILDNLEKTPSHSVDPYENGITQLSLFQEEQSPILTELHGLNLDSISPRQALDILYRWKGEPGM